MVIQTYRLRALAFRALCPAVLLILLCPGFPRPASADLLDPREIALIMESSLVDLDTSMIALHHGPDSNSQLNYASRIDETGWAGRLFGTYGGRDVDIYYTGDVTYVGGPTNQFDVSYTSDWYFDGQTGTGSGSGVYNDPEFSFDIDLINMSVSGSISVSYGVASLTLAGTKDLDDHKLTVSGTAGAIDIPYIGNLAEAELALEYDQLTGQYVSTASGRILGGFLGLETTETLNRGSIRRPRMPPPPPFPPAPPPRPDPPPTIPYPYPDYDSESDPGFGAIGTPVPGYNNMTVLSVPEPAALSLVLIGALLMLPWKRRYCAAGNGARTSDDL